MNLLEFSEFFRGNFHNNFHSHVVRTRDIRLDFCIFQSIAFVNSFVCFAVRNMKGIADKLALLSEWKK